MTIHLIKLCVGVSTPEELAGFWRDRVAAIKRGDKNVRTWHLTRHAPRRQDEVLDGGSLYWVIKGYVQARQRITDLEARTGEDGGKRCAIHLDSTVVRTHALPWRPFQGWRYLDPAKAPPDLDAQGGDAADMPPEMVAELRELGLM